MSNIIFYTHPMSRGRTVRWMLEECGANYETHYLTFNGTMKSDDYLKINPMGKVPTLVHNGKVITETAAIIAYLAEIFPEKNLIPHNRADYYRWLFYVAGPAESAFMDKLIGLEPDATAQIFLGYGNVEHVINTLENWLKKHPYIAGEQFSAADCYVASFLDFLREQNLYDSEIFQNYYQPLLNRPASLTATALDDAAQADMEGSAK